MGTQVAQKLINYGIPYVIFSTLWILMKMALPSFTNTSVSLKELLMIPFYPVNFMWYIYALLLMEIIQVLIGNRSLRFKIIHLILAIAAYFFRPYLASILTNIRFSDCVLSDFMKFYVFFLLGLYCGEFISKWLWENKKILIPVLGGTLVLGNIAIYFNSFLGSSIVSFILALIGSLFIIGISQVIRNSRVICYLGGHSLPIYVLQGFAIVAIRLVLTEFHLNDAIGIVPMLACTVMGVCLPIAAYWISTKVWKFEFCFYPGKYIRLKD